MKDFCLSGCPRQEVQFCLEGRQKSSYLGYFIIEQAVSHYHFIHGFDNASAFIDMSSSFLSYLSNHIFSILLFKFPALPILYLNYQIFPSKISI